MASDRNHTRHLPHQVPEGIAPIFLTWNLKGAMPGAVVEELRRERRSLEDQPSRPGEPNTERRIRKQAALRRGRPVLDQAADGPMHLKDPHAAKIVEDSLLFGAGGSSMTSWPGVSCRTTCTSCSRHVGLGKVTQGIKG